MIIIYELGETFPLTETWTFERDNSAHVRKVHWETAYSAVLTCFIKVICS
jgi:hypothetical protein